MEIDKYIMRIWSERKQERWNVNKGEKKEEKRLREEMWTARIWKEEPREEKRNMGERNGENMIIQDITKIRRRKKREEMWRRIWKEARGEKKEYGS